MHSLPGSRPPRRSWARCRASRGTSDSGRHARGDRRGTARGTCGSNVGSRSWTPPSVRDRCSSTPPRSGPERILRPGSPRRGART
eukprot:4171100-Prymnesium_polylepis.1